jgi:signal transduction histidine kinase
MNAFAVANPFGTLPLPAWWFSFFHNMFGLSTIAQNLVTMAALVVRYRRSVGDERLQMKWLVYFLTMALGILLVFDIPGIFFYPQLMKSVWFALVVWAVFLGFPLIIGLAIFKYRLYDIDRLINRTLVYGGLTLLVVLIYTLIVGGFSQLFHTSGSLPISFIATALIAIAFQPAREYLQCSINRLMFGQRDDPYAVLSHLSQTLQTTAVPSETLTSIVETIAATLKLPYAAIELLEQAEQIGQAAVGEPVAEIVELPLRYQKESVGRLLVSPRAPGETFTAKEQKLLADIAAQTGPVASATRLTLALQRSREKLVLAREEERRRIRRDLHDGLGPTLASQTLKLDTVLDLLAADPDAAGQQVKQLKQQTQHMVADIRRLVYELRPPALDELGLLEALRAHVAQMSSANGGLRISIEASPEPLPPLSAAIEVAAYRIALEGVTNVIHHAQAHRCCVRFAITEGQPLPSLVIIVTDDGRGLPAKFQSGVGLTSMRERAEELGGHCEVTSNGLGGTQVTARLPFSANGADK